jgi:hypothetical protein
MNTSAISAPLREESAKHQCPIPGCGKTIRADLLMCFRHWGAVPQNLQIKICALWHTWRRHRDPADLRRYRTTRDLAITIVTEKFSGRVAAPPATASVDAHAPHSALGIPSSFNIRHSSLTP